MQNSANKFLVPSFCSRHLLFKTSPLLPPSPSLWPFLYLMLPMAFPSLSYRLLFQISMCLLIANTILQVSGLCLKEERYSLLLAFPKDSTPQSWSLNTDCCGWSGVRYNNSTGHVIHLDLSNRSLSNRFNFSSLVGLSNLQTLDLSCNKFDSSIPTALFQLSSLTSLNLSYSAFTNEIPHEISLLKNLTVLDLRGNQLDGRIPPSLFTLPFLQILMLGNNRLDGHPEKFLNISSSLKVVDLSYNYMVGQIPCVGILPSSTSTGLSRNSSDPAVTSASHYNITISLLLSNNRFRGEIPDFICNLRNLKILDLSSNNLSGRISDCLRKLSTVLIVANLRNNRFTGAMPEFPSEKCSLRTLNLNGNQLEGPMPESLPNCGELEVLDVGNNCLRGPFPLYNRTLSKLRVLVLRSNKFNGSVPNPINSVFPLIQIIDISSNCFSGPLCSVTKLQGMMSGAEDKEPGPYPQVIRYNFFKGLYYQDSVAIVSKGMVMELVKILTIFKSLDVSNNKFQGEIPLDIGELNLLLVLNMSHNNLAGQIPPSIGKLSLLESLDLSENNLSGDIPQQMTNLTFLSVLTLSNNQLSGKIPNARQFLTFTNESFLGNSGLCGPPLLVQCGAANAVPSHSADGNEDSEANGCDWEKIAMGVGFGGGMGMVVVLVLFHNRHEMEAMNFLSGKCSHLGGEHFLGVGEEEFDQELSEREEEEWSHPFCVFCSQIDARWEKVIHKECYCHDISTLFYSQQSYISKATPDRETMKVI